MDLSASRKQYTKSGYCKVPGFVDAEFVSGLLAEIEGLEGIDVFRDNEGRLRRLERIYDKGRLLRELDAKIRAALREMFSEDVVIFKDKFNAKPPGGEGFRAHYDGVFVWKDGEGRERNGWYEYAPVFYNVLVALDPCTAENGPLEIAPAHEEDFDTLLARNRNGTPELADTAGLSFEKLLLEPGDAAFFSHKCPHRSVKNTSRSPRRMIYYTYNRLADGDNYARYFADKASSQGTNKSFSFPK